MYLTLQLYSCIVSRVFGDYAEPEAAVPRHHSPEVRRQRFVHYAFTLRTRLWKLRLWWIAFAAWWVGKTSSNLLSLRCGGSADRSYIVQSLSSGSIGPLVFTWAPLRAAQCLSIDPALAASAGADLALLKYHHDAIALPSIVYYLSRLAVLAVVHCAPLLLAALAVYSLLAVDATDFSGEPKNSSQASWLWPVGWAGVAPNQAAPPRMSGPSYAAAAVVEPLLRKLEAESAAAPSAVPIDTATLAASSPITPPPSTACSGSAAGTARRRASSSSRGGSRAPADALMSLVSPLPADAASSSMVRRRRSSMASKSAASASAGSGLLVSPPVAASTSGDGRRRRSSSIGKDSSVPSSSLFTSSAHSAPSSAAGLSMNTSAGASGSYGSGTTASTATVPDSLLLSPPSDYHPQLLSPPALAKRVRAAPAAGPQYRYPDSAQLVAASAVAPIPVSLPTESGDGAVGPVVDIGQQLRAMGGHRMRIAILTLGTRGDVQPYIALGSFLRDAGHSVIISSTDDFEALVTSAGLEFGRTGAPRIAQPEHWVDDKTVTVGDMIRAGAELFAPGYAKIAGGFTAASQGADVLIGTSMTVTFALNLAEAGGYAQQVCIAKLAPDIPSRAFVPPGPFPPGRFGLLNLMRYYGYWIDVSHAVGKAGLTALENQFRARLGLGPIAVKHRLEQMFATPMLLGWSSYLFPPPSDYPPWALPCGFWMSYDAEDYVPRSVVSCSFS